MMLLSVHRQDGYGAFKRRERCEVCHAQTGKVGVWRAEFDDGSKRYFCDDHICVAFADQ